MAITASFNSTQNKNEKNKKTKEDKVIFQTMQAIPVLYEHCHSSLAIVGKPFCCTRTIPARYHLCTGAAPTTLIIFFLYFITMKD